MFRWILAQTELDLCNGYSKIRGTIHLNRKITGYHQDHEHHWVAELECGHGQHVRHEPPFFKREWAITQAGRDSHLGSELNCVRCDEFARELLEECRSQMSAAYDSGGLSGICEEGRWDLALDALKVLKKKFESRP